MKLRQANDRRAFPFRYKGVRRHQVLLDGASSTSPATHQSRGWNWIEIQHRKIICLSIIILSMFRKEHDNTSKAAVIPGYSRERHTQGSKKGALSAHLRWQLWAFLGHTEPQEQSSDRDKALTGATGHTDTLLRWQSDLANPSLSERSWTMQIIRVLLPQTPEQHWDMLAVLSHRVSSHTSTKSRKTEQTWEKCSPQMGIQLIKYWAGVHGKITTENTTQTLWIQLGDLLGCINSNTS